MDLNPFRPEWHIQHDRTSILFTSLTLLLCLGVLVAYNVCVKENMRGMKQPLPIRTGQEVVINQPNDSFTDSANFKSWMDYRAITNKESTQYTLQKFAETDAIGRRTFNGIPMIAIGTGWGASVGDYVIVLTETQSFGFIVGDIKSDRHTDDTHKIDINNGSIIEFIVDADRIPTTIKRTGNFSYYKLYESPVLLIYQEVMP